LIRQLRELHKLGVRECDIFVQDPLPLDLSGDRVPADMAVRTIPYTPDKLPHHLQTLANPEHGILILRGDWLIDPRLLAALLASPSAQWLQPPALPAGMLPPAARLSLKCLNLWAASGLDAWLHASPALDPQTLDTYQPSHRGHKPFYLKAMTTPADAADATRTVVEAAQKRALDLPALLLHPMFENRLVLWLCNTPITPNHVTLFTAFLGAIIAALFLNGWLRLGILLAYGVAILDGVDGKLARTTLRTSRLGEVEHVLDFFVEHAWYLTLTLFFVSQTGDPSVWWMGGGLMAGDLLDKLLYMTGHLRLGKQLDELGPFDRRFRLIAGRRNIYLWMFILGFWGDLPLQALTVACVWALGTASVHSVRLAYHLMRRQIITA
jgi:phosphatidylglycerophosphate synthase